MSVSQDQLRDPSGEGIAPESSTAHFNQKAAPSEPKGTSRHATSFQECAQGLPAIPPGTKRYAVFVTDVDNETQINETRKWLEGLVKIHSEIAK